MAVVSLKVGGRDYQVACDDGQEEELRLLADDVDDRVQALTFGKTGSQSSEAIRLLMAALTMADELAENKKEIKKLASQLSEEKQAEHESRIAEMEAAMAVTLEEIALRIERIAQRIEVS